MADNNPLPFLLLSVLSAIAVTALLGLYQGSVIINPTGAQEQVVTPSYTEWTNVTYCPELYGKVVGYPTEILKRTTRITFYTMDIYVPSSANGTIPLVIYLHGGAWVTGDKSAIQQQFFFRYLIDNGYAIASVNYPDENTSISQIFPDNIESAKCAVRYLKGSAANYSIDPDEIGVIGTSAGGQLAGLLGTTNDSLWTTAEYGSQTSTVNGVIEFYAINNISGVQSTIPQASTYFAGNEVAASPIAHVSPQSVPFLIIQGSNDTTVSQSQATAMYNALQGNGIQSQLIMVENGGHGFAGESEPNLAPDYQEMNESILQFLDRYVRK